MPSLGKISLQTPAMAPPTSPAGHYAQETQDDPPPQRSEAVVSLVDVQGNPPRPPDLETPERPGHDGCQPPGLGSDTRDTASPGQMEPRRADTQHQLAGAPGNSAFSSRLQSVDPPEISPGQDGQHHSQGPCQSSRRNQIQVPDERGPFPSNMGRGQPPNSGGRAPSRIPKLKSRLAKQSGHRPGRVESPSSDLPDHQGQTRPTRTGPVRLPRQRQDAQVSLKIPDRRGRRNGRPQLPMASGPSLRLPTDSAAHEAPSQNTQDQRTGHPRGSSVAAAALVLRDSRHGNSRVRPSTQTGSPHARTDPPPRPSLATASRLEIERRMLKGYGYSSEVVDSILASRRQSTNRIYEYTFRTFRRWCKVKNKDFIKISVPTVLQFLQDGFLQGLRPNTVKRQVAAITSILPHDDAARISQHPHIRRLLKGVANMAPPTKHRFPSWDLHKVLKALTIPPFEPLREVPLKFLTFKTLLLTALTSARRVSEIGALSIRKELCIIRPDSIILRPDPTFIPKVNSVFHTSQDIVLPSFCPRPKEDLEKCWHTLDVRRAIKIYLKRTATFRRSESLFVSFRPNSKGKKVSRPTLARWIKQCIVQCYKSLKLQPPADITAHSTRSAATSAALSTNAPLAEICRAATWKSPSTFTRHYKLDLFQSSEAAFGRRVLQHVLSDPPSAPVSPP
ncbi:uncharacterized protein LOC121919745 [Sceloporus undulatus]|uniref:uncharacterized protein LOC121919745 n=1 Tax=Sceloporus undulatus TaxID=8520 RepID=UPI001C4C3D96|nr:uncharacterized protein LOC121919745 [Sceloporus undulatus]